MHFSPVYYLGYEREVYLIAPFDDVSVVGVVESCARWPLGGSWLVDCGSLAGETYLDSALLPLR
jgi:hypothetical protein